MDLQWLLAVDGVLLRDLFHAGAEQHDADGVGAQLSACGARCRTCSASSIGFPVMVFSVGLGIAQIFKAYPVLYVVLKVVSIVYLVWLALQIAMADGVKTGRGRYAAADVLAGGGVPVGQPEGLDHGGRDQRDLSGAGRVLGEPGGVDRCFPGRGALFVVDVGAGRGGAARRLIGNRSGVRVINIVLALLLVASLWPIGRELIAEL